MSGDQWVALISALIGLVSTLGVRLIDRWLPDPHPGPTPPAVPGAPSAQAH